jgi:hypothetical protein
MCTYMQAMEAQAPHGTSVTGTSMEASTCVTRGPKHCSAAAKRCPEGPCISAQRAASRMDSGVITFSPGPRVILGPRLSWRTTSPCHLMPFTLSWTEARTSAQHNGTGTRLQVGED